MNYILIIGVLALVAILVVVLVLLNKNPDTPKSYGPKALYSECKNSFDCGLGFHCELRNHPSKGICVIPPGGACHSVSGNKTTACYSGYHCDEQDGVCLK